MNELLARLERSLLDRNRVLWNRLKQGLPPNTIRESLAKSGANGNVDSIVELFSWKNGSNLDPSVSEMEASLFPASPFMFMEFEYITTYFTGIFRDGDCTHRFFPLFWDGSCMFIAVELGPVKNGRIVVVDSQVEEMWMVAYDSAGEFWKDAIDANKENIAMAPLMRATASLLLRRLEGAIRARNPMLANCLQNGLKESVIRSKLVEAGVAGAIEPIVSLFEWKNGGKFSTDVSLFETSPFPQSIYGFIDLDTALEHYRTLNDALHYHPSGHKFRNRYFPLLWDSSNGWIGIDLKSFDQNRVVLMFMESDAFAYPAYETFTKFLTFAILSNQVCRSLTCFEKLNLASQP